MTRFAQLAVLSLLIGTLTGCSRGLLYTDTVTPYCTEMNTTPAEGISSSSGVRQVSIPRVPGTRAVWSTNSIADAAAAEGLSTVYYCDRKEFSVLLGLWKEDSVVVYGK